MSKALVLIDLQNDYFPGGRMELVGADDAVRQAARLLDPSRPRSPPGGPASENVAPARFARCGTWSPCSARRRNA